MSSMSDNIPTPAPHEDALAAARAAVIQVLTSTAEQREQILHEASTERKTLLTSAQAEATSITDQARGSAAQLREQAEADAEHIRDDAHREAESIVEDARREAEDVLNEARGAAERIRGDAAADAHRTRTQAETDAQALRTSAVSVADEVRTALADLHGVESRLTDVVGPGPEPAEGPATESATDDLSTAGTTAPDLPPPSPDDIIQLGPATDAKPAAPEPSDTTPLVTAPTPQPAPVAEQPTPEPEPELTSEQIDDFMRQLAEHLDNLDRARSAGDCDEVGRVLTDLGTLAARSHANELAALARHLGPDARPEELDELIRQCYEVRQGCRSATPGV